MSRIVVGSTSTIKLDAIRDIIPLFIDNFKLPKPVNVIGLNVESGVSPQPVGMTETLEGATNRVKNVKLLEPKADIWVGIENGLMESKSLDEILWINKAVKSPNRESRIRKQNTSLWVDVAVIWMEGFNWSFPIISEPLYIPDDVLEERYGNQYDNLSEGVDVNWSDSKDPHVMYSHKKRQTFISDAIRGIFQK